MIEPDGTRVLCVHNPRISVDIELISDLRTMSHVWAGDMDMRIAEDAGRLELKGDPILVRTSRHAAAGNLRPYPATVWTA